MKLTRTAIIGIGIGVVALAALAYTLRPKPIVVDTAVLARGPLETTVDADGRTRVRNRYVVVAPVTGKVERITQIEGTRARAGDVIARLTPVPLDSQSLIQAQTRIDAADAAVRGARSEVRVATAAAEQRRRELSRANRLVVVGGVAPRVVEESELALLEADEAVQAAKERAEAATADARQARAVLLGRANAGGTVVVRAPVSGRVLRVPERSERLVTSGTPLLELGDPGALEIVIDVLSSDGAKVHPGDRVRLAQWGAESDGEGDATNWGRVRDVEPAGFTKVSALGVDEQRVNVIVDPDAVPSSIGDGFRVDASIIVWSARDVLAVPRSALLHSTAPGPDTGEWIAFVVKAGRAERRVVRIGHVGGAAAEVVSGVQSGDEVVLFPSDRIAAGVRVASRNR